MEKDYVIKKIEENAELIVNPSAKELRKMAEKDERTTEYGSASYISKIRSRSAKKTFIVPEVELGIKQKEITEKEADG